MIVIFPDPILRQPCDSVEYGGVAATTATERLLQAYERLTEKPLGIAAPQVGLSYRVILVQIKGEPRIFYNPKILARGELVITAPEGCLSLPGIEVKVPRPSYIMLRALDEHGREVQQVINGMLARVFQHEIDHLDGILIIDKLGKKERKEALKKLREERDGQHINY